MWLDAVYSEYLWCNAVEALYVAMQTTAVICSLNSIYVNDP
jgi:hypothetical protein